MSAQLTYVDCPSHQLDLFKPVGVQTQVKQCRDVKFLPVGAIQENAPISFHVPKSPFYMDPRQMYFVTVVEIVAGNGQSLAGKSFTDDSDLSKLEKVGVINYLGKTLWLQMDFRINDTPINPSNCFYAYQSCVEALLFYTEAEAKTLLSGLELFEKDSGNITASYPTATSKNQGLINRSAQFEGGKKVKIYTRPHVNICHQDFHLPDGCKLDIRQHPNPNQFVLMSANDVDGYRLKFILVHVNSS